MRFVADGRKCAIIVCLGFGLGFAWAQSKPPDPRAWGDNHVGKPVPDYVSGDECLFCHRNDIGPTWAQNAHGVTVRLSQTDPGVLDQIKNEPELAAVLPEIQYFLGSRGRIRMMRKEGYGRFALLETQAAVGLDGRILHWHGLDAQRWDTQKFGDRCAGCHATAVDPTDRTFSAFGLDCYTCHGFVDLEHSNDTRLVLLSKKGRRDKRVVTSICAQCHLRFGTSRSTGLPYPNNFVAGDNLLQDFEVDFSRADDMSLNPGDRHIYRNVREVLLRDGDRTCLNCHDVHKGSSRKHRLALKTDICADCHYEEGPMQDFKPFEVHSELCEY